MRGTDIVIDIGDSLNSAIDIGQVEGAFVQGYGLTVIEECKVAPDGRWLTRGPGTYKIPRYCNTCQAIDNNNHIKQCRRLPATLQCASAQGQL